MPLHFLGLLLIIAGYLLAALSAGTPLLFLFDLASFFIILLPASGAVLIQCGWKNAWRTVFYILSGRLTPKAKATVIGQAIQVTIRITMWAGLAGALIGFVGMLSYMNTFENIKGLPKALAASLLTILYALCVAIILYPMQLRLQKKG